jgi:hypothetical protein
MPDLCPYFNRKSRFLVLSLTNNWLSAVRHRLVSGRRCSMLLEMLSAEQRRLPRTLEHSTARAQQTAR